MRRLRLLGYGSLACLVLATGDGAAQAPKQAVPPPARPGPKLVAIAETKLLMEGILNPNFRGAEKQLTQKPADDAAWAIVRGQALLAGEAGNLLMLRPPRNAGQEAWMDRAIDLRETASRLGQHAANKDLERSRLGLIDLAASCTRCHQAFRVPVKIAAFADPAP